jgi:hypothetical protein
MVTLFLEKNNSFLWFLLFLVVLSLIISFIFKLTIFSTSLFFPKNEDDFFKQPWSAKVELYEVLGIPREIRRKYKILLFLIKCLSYYYWISWSIFVAAIVREIESYPDERNIWLYYITGFVFMLKPISGLLVISRKIDDNSRDTINLTVISVLSIMFYFGTCSTNILDRISIFYLLLF